MKAKTKSLRSPLAHAQGLGSARHGSGHWIGLRLTALALIPLSIYVVVTFFTNVVSDGYSGAVDWLISPFSSVLVILFLAVGFHHAANGTQVVIEDYVHCEALKLACVITVKFISVALALLGALAVLKILFFGLGIVVAPHA